MKPLTTKPIIMKTSHHLITRLLAGLLLYPLHTAALELTPFAGYRGGGEVIDASTDTRHRLDSSSLAGLLVSAPYERGKTLELYYSRQHTAVRSVMISPTPAPYAPSPQALALTIDYLHLGGAVPIEKGKHLQTFVSGGLGFTRLKPGVSGLDTELRASLSVGLGLRLPVGEHLALRLESRVLATLFQNNASLFCNGGCTLKVNGNFFYQGEVFAGLAIRF